MQIVFNPLRKVYCDPYEGIFFIPHTEDVFGVLTDANHPGTGYYVLHGEQDLAMIERDYYNLTEGCAFVLTKDITFDVDRYESEEPEIQVDRFSIAEELENKHNYKAASREYDAARR